jgi:hypothetical protein
MTCQKCQSAVATFRVTERLPSGGFAQAHYCAACCAPLMQPSPWPKRLPSREAIARMVAAVNQESGLNLDEDAVIDFLLQQCQQRASGQSDLP